MHASSGRVFMTAIRRPGHLGASATGRSSSKHAGHAFEGSNSPSSATFSGLRVHATLLVGWDWCSNSAYIPTQAASCKLPRRPYNHTIGKRTRLVGTGEINKQTDKSNICRSFFDRGVSIRTHNTIESLRCSGTHDSPERHDTGPVNSFDFTDTAMCFGTQNPESPTFRWPGTRLARSQFNRVGSACKVDASIIDPLSSLHFAVSVLLQTSPYSKQHN
ncbi:hypothetical protein LY76DRAFT_345729 [Colletotrichum caudatum]|nr:hypothetical protein LY76DRAFT_345729 [Colletotrichum caudatum]